jgi:lipopolysaccharide transport system permease protein
MSIAANFDRNDRRLGLNFAIMMLRDRYLGTGLGTFWAIAQPLLLIGVFVYVFTYLFKSRLGIERESDFSFIIWLVSGYGPWLAINEGLTSGATSVVTQVGIVKNMAFKTELLPIAATTLGLMPLLVSMAVLLGLIFMDGRAPDATWAIMPVILLFQMLFVAGLGLMLGALNVFVRDVTFVLPSLLTMLLFLSPVFYPITIFPETMREIVQWNPIHVIANGYRLPIVEGKLPPVEQLIYLAVLSIVTFMLGLGMFRRMKPFFHSRL